jgi:hypothetical protein
MSEKLRILRWLPMSGGALVLTAAMLSGPVYGAAASTAHRGILLPRHPARSMAPGTPAVFVPRGRQQLAMGAGHATAARGYRESDTVLLVGICGHAPTDAAFTWAKAKKLLHVR